MTGSLRVTLQPGQWRARPGLLAGDVRPNEGEALEIQLVPWTVQLVLDEVDRPTGWVAAQGWWHRPDEPAPDRVQLLIRADALPEDVVPEPPAGGDR